MPVEKHKDYFKCDTPQNTIGRIEKGLGKLGLEIKYFSFSYKVLKDIYWGAANIPVLNLHSSGKGTTPLLAKASAYSELVERLLSQLLVVSKLINTEQSESFRRYDFLQRGQQSYEIISRILPSLNMTEELMAQDVCKDWIKGISLISSKQVSVPIRLIDKISFSNGLASGNNELEAVIQASCEIFERKTLLSAVLNRKRFPTIKEVDDPRVKYYISFFQKNNFDVILKDMSNNGKYPCIGLVLVNNNLVNANKLQSSFGRVMFNVGSSLDRNEAMIRCFTERLQRWDFYNFKYHTTMDLMWKTFFESVDIEYEPRSLQSLLFRFNMFDGNLEHLIADNGDEPSSEPFIDSKDCSVQLEKIKSICRMIDSDLVKVSLTHPVVDFPVVRVIIPGHSDVLGYYLEKDYSYEELIEHMNTDPDHRYLKIYENMDKLTKEKANDMIVSIENEIRKKPIRSITKKKANGITNIDLIQYLKALSIFIGDKRREGLYSEFLQSEYQEQIRFQKGEYKNGQNPFHAKSLEPVTSERVSKIINGYFR